jgi:hypothetical protein
LIFTLLALFPIWKEIPATINKNLEINYYNKQLSYENHALKTIAAIT